MIISYVNILLNYIYSKVKKAVLRFLYFCGFLQLIIARIFCRLFISYHLTKENFVLWITYIRLQQQINTPKSPQFCLPCTHRAWHVKGGGFRKKTGGIDFNKIFCSYPNIVHKQNTSNLSVGWRRQLSLPKRALPFVRFKMLIYSQTSVPFRTNNPQKQIYL